MLGVMNNASPADQEKNNKKTTSEAQELTLQLTVFKE